MLGSLATRLSEARLDGSGDVDVIDVSHDSRLVTPGCLFVAVRGYSSDGNAYVEQALARGAVAVASEAEPRGNIPWLRVPDARSALAELAASVHGRPFEEFDLVGVTGTNGKTTVTHLIDAALRAGGLRVGVIGTVQHRVGDRLVAARHTTPEASDLQRLLREMVNEKCDACVMEVSSHSLSLKRVHDTRFSVAVFTNLSRDHLDFHGDVEAYFAAKRALFESHLREDGHAIVNADDPRAEEITSVARGRVTTFGLERPADIQAEDVRVSLDGTRFRLEASGVELEISSPLIGRFNVSNLLAAYAAATTLGVAPDVVAAAFNEFAGVRGRMERIDRGQPFGVLVDYAHSDDALRLALEAARDLGPRRVVTVFGCGGGRDRGKRSLMGAVAARLSDVVIVTSDNPRDEPPESIIDDIRRGLNGTRHAVVHYVVDRREAIALALGEAGEGDLVVIAGKGHEVTQVIRERAIPFDDRQVVRDLLARPSTAGRS